MTITTETPISPLHILKTPSDTSFFPGETGQNRDEEHPPQGYCVAIMADGLFYPQRLVSDGTAHFLSASESTDWLSFACYNDAVSTCWEIVISEEHYQEAMERVTSWQSAQPLSDRVVSLQLLRHHPEYCVTPRLFKEGDER